MSELTLPLHPSMTHPLTGERLRALYVDSKGRARYPIMGGAPEDPPNPDDKKTGDKPDDKKVDPPNPDDKKTEDDLGFPAKTPVKDMTPAQQAAYHLHQSRKHEGRAREWHDTLGGKTPEEVKAELDRLAELDKQQMTDSERAIADAKAEAKVEALREYGSELVKARFEAALTHVDEERRTKIIEGLNLSSYLDNEGRVDTDKVKSYAAVVAPVDTTTTPRTRDYGAGQRRTGEVKRGAAGSAEAARRFGDKTKSTTDA